MRLDLQSWALLASALALVNGDPIVKTLNGSYSGAALPDFQQEVFLGIPYSQPPVGSLRLRHPQSLNTSFSGVRNATSYGYTCPGFDDATLYNLHEDCLTLNIVRPAVNGSQHQLEHLPVLVWIYGGGFQTGATADPQYNLSFLVQTSVEAGMPIIAASLNYRKATFGFLGGTDMVNSGNMNLGLRDQRMALDWIQENIHAFGGSREKVTIFGQSSGGAAVGFQLQAYGGQGRPPFRAAIMESGSMNSQPENGTDYHQPMYEAILEKANCTDTADRLDCLRALSYEDYSLASGSNVFFPTVDGDFVPALGSIVKNNAKFHHVPIIAGTATDDATEFAPLDRNTSAEVSQPPLVTGTGYIISNSSWEKILAFYPDDPALGIPANTGSERFASFGGYEYKRMCAIGGDALYHGPRRQDTRVFAKGDVQPVYSYRFDTVPYVNATNATHVDLDGTPQYPYYGVSHGAELPFVFNNPSRGLGSMLAPDTAPIAKSHRQLALIASRMWIAFVHRLDPNKHGLDGVTVWPMYHEKTQLGSNFVFNASIEGGGLIEDDTWRGEGIDFLISTMVERAQ